MTWWPVHPRVCGERHASALCESRRVGSSPRVRGTHLVAGELGVADRFIPACAGNAMRCCATAGTTPVHPRVCGERNSQAVSLYRFVGSSPRVRGTLDCLRLPEYRARFIPACAGNAPADLGRQIRCTVHPRVCGERALAARSAACAAGSSPRVRGTRLSGSQGAP